MGNTITIPAFRIILILLGVTQFRGKIGGVWAGHDPPKHHRTPTNCVSSNMDKCICKTIAFELNYLLSRKRGAIV